MNTGQGREVGKKNKTGDCGITEAKGRGSIKMEAVVKHHRLLGVKGKN